MLSWSTSESEDCWDFDKDFGERQGDDGVDKDGDGEGEGRILFFEFKTVL
jgi:hypothetical protein